MMIELTSKQKRFLSELSSYIEREGRPPTIRELQEIMQLRSPRTVGQYLEYLEDAGCISRGKGARNIQVLRKPAASTVHAQTIQIPVVGNVACGSPSLAEEEVGGYVAVSKDIAKAPYRYFILRTKKDSMDAAGIKEGDLVLVRQQTDAKDGDDVVALIDDEATIKRFYRSKDFISLKPVSNNKENRPIILKKDFQIQGVVIKNLGRCNDLVS